MYRCLGGGVGGGVRVWSICAQISHLGCKVVKLVRRAETLQHSRNNKRQVISAPKGQSNSTILCGCQVPVCLAVVSPQRHQSSERPRKGRHSSVLMSKPQRCQREMTTTSARPSRCRHAIFQIHSEESEAKDPQQYNVAKGPSKQQYTKGPTFSLGFPL